MLYLRFRKFWNIWGILATTEIKKVPVTIVSSVKSDLSRIKSSELFEFIKKIKDKENGKVTDEALKLIVKISEDQ